MKKTMVLGATPNPNRYAFRAVNQLQAAGHEVVPVGIKKGEVGGLEIHNDRPKINAIDTVTLYIGPRHQPEWYDYILQLNPERIIFNPGTENSEFEQLARSKGIETEEACTLVMLSIGNY
jgi:predicted CoA-binding protein